MRLFDETVSRLSIEKTIGPEETEKLISHAEQLSGLPCPFCGGKPVMDIGIIYREDLTIGIRCQECGCRTGYLVCGKLANGKTYTPAERLDQTLEIWNRRKQR